jgi:RNA polymerase sigma factor (sigma-70 family)
VTNVTKILGAMQQGDPKAAGELLPMVYQELRHLAAARMANELPGQTLQPTALVHEALDKFAAQDPRKAELVKLRYFAGLKIEEAAQVLGVSEPTAHRWWAYARAWLFQEINSQRGG